MFLDGKLPEIATARLRLRRLRDDDAEFLVLLDTDPRVMEHIHDGPMTRAQAARFAKSMIEAAGLKRYFGRWIVEERGAGVRLGWVEMYRLRGEKRDDLQAAYQFSPAHWGKGFATDALRALLAYSFGARGLDRVAAVTRPVNSRSVRLLQRCGFVKTSDKAFDETGHPADLWFCYRRGPGEEEESVSDEWRKLG